MSQHQAKFEVGQIVQHRMFDYIGVIFDVDAVFSGSAEWYEEVAKSRPPTPMTGSCESQAPAVKR